MSINYFFFFLVFSCPTPKIDQNYKFLNMDL